MRAMGDHGMERIFRFDIARCLAEYKQKATRGDRSLEKAKNGSSGNRKAGGSKSHIYKS